MSKYYISDLHFMSETIMRVHDKRPFSTVEEMNEELIRRWNDKIKGDNNPVIYMLGDLFSGRRFDDRAKDINRILHKLNGRINLITGNHDESWMKVAGVDLNRFNNIDMIKEIQDGQTDLLLCHYPIPFFKGSRGKRSDGSPRKYMLYGHLHNSPEEESFLKFRALQEEIAAKDNRQVSINSINCWCGYYDYTPQTIEELIKKSKEIKL